VQLEFRSGDIREHSPKRTFGCAVCHRLRMKTPRLGDIFSLQVPNGQVVYGQYVYEHSEPPSWGSLLRFPKATYPASLDVPSTLFEVANHGHYFFAWTALRGLLKHGRSITSAGNAPLLGFNLPLFRVGLTGTTWPDRHAGEKMSDAQLDALPNITAYMELSLIEAVAEAAGMTVPPEVGESWYEAEVASRGGRSVPPVSSASDTQVILIKVPHDQLTDEVRAVVADAVAIAEEAGADVDGEEFGPNGLTVFVYADDVEAILQCLSGALTRSGAHARDVSLSVVPAD
jgi:hypothetical protein